jgi:hypothetical protein
MVKYWSVIELAERSPQFIGDIKEQARARAFQLLPLEVRTLLIRSMKDLTAADEYDAA